MSIKRLKILCWIFVLFLFTNAAALSAGGQPDDSIDENVIEEINGLPLVKDHVTIDYFMANHKTKPFTANDLTIAELQRRTNVYFNIISIDSGYWDKYKFMLASGDLPDVVFTTVADAKKYGMDNLFIPLDDLLKQYGSNILQAMREEDIEDDMKAMDGKIYFFPKISLQQPEPFMVRQDWLEKYNIKPPETLEDIYQMLKTFKEQDPAGNGQTIPYGSMMYNDPSICYLNAFYRAFTVDQDFMLKDNQIVWGPAQPGMLEAMKYLNRLYNEGLLDNEAPVLAKKQWEERVSSGRVGMIVYSAVRADFFTEVLRRTNPDAKMVGFKPPFGIDGKRHIPPMPRFSTNFCMAITRDSTQAEIIVKFFDYVFSPEGRMIISYGVEGDSYEIREGKPEFTEKMYRQDVGWNMFVKAAIGGRRIASWSYDDAMLQQYKGTLAFDAINLSLPYLDETTPMLNFNQEELNVIESRYRDLKDKTSDYLLKFLIGELSADSSWNEYILELKRIGLDELEEAYNNAYIRRYQ